MIGIKNKTECCGCQACGDICNRKAISFKIDEEGIWYPVVDKDTCVECGLCEKVCPIINRVTCATNALTPQCYVLQALDSYDRFQSASGAAYSLLARAVFEQGGIVAGHVWDGQFGVKGFVSGEEKDLELLRGTKYLQSNVEGLYLAVGDYLKKGRLVLFSGTPCQNAAMRSFLEKDYDNLIMTDFVCMGIDSPFAFKKYLESLENRFNSKVVLFKAKSKEIGWRYLTNKAVFENGNTYFGINGIDANLIATFENVLVRPSCYDCKFKGFPRISDMTIGDFWRKIKENDPLDDNTGTSFVMLHNKKAAVFFEHIKPSCRWREGVFSEILAANQYALASLPKPVIDRKEFYNRLHTEDFIQLVDDLSKKGNANGTLYSRIKNTVIQLVKSFYYCRKYPMSFLYFIYYNMMSKKVKSNLGNGDTLVLRNVHLIIEKGAAIYVKGTCILDAKGTPTVIHLGNNASLYLDSNLISEGVSINVEEDSFVKLGFKTIVNKSSSIVSQSGVTIGDYSVVGEDVRISNANQRALYFGETNKSSNHIKIGTHVLMNKGCILKQGVDIRDETIIREYSVVEGSFGPRTVLSGNPAVEENTTIYWKYNFENIWNFKN